LASVFLLLLLADLTPTSRTLATAAWFAGPLLALVKRQVLLVPFQPQRPLCSFAFDSPAAGRGFSAANWQQSLSVIAPYDTLPLALSSYGRPTIQRPRCPPPV